MTAKSRTNTLSVDWRPEFRLGVKNVMAIGAWAFGHFAVQSIHIDPLAPISLFLYASITAVTLPLALLAAFEFSATQNRLGSSVAILLALSVCIGLAIQSLFQEIRHVFMVSLCMAQGALISCFVLQRLLFSFREVPHFKTNIADHLFLVTSAAFIASIFANFGRRSDLELYIPAFVNGCILGCAVFFWANSITGIPARKYLALFSIAGLLIFLECVVAVGYWYNSNFFFLSGSFYAWFCVVLTFAITQGTLFLGYKHLGTSHLVKLPTNLHH